MDTKDSFVFFLLLLLSFGLFGSLTLTYCVWNKQAEMTRELADLQNELLSKFPGELLAKGQLKQNVRQAYEDTDSPLAMEIRNALTEINEMKLLQADYMNCSKNEFNHTKCTLKSGPKGEPGPPGPSGPEGPPGIQGKDGSKGEQGVVGAKGDMGERGLKGNMGPPGSRGETGEKGAKGEPGDIGQKGEPGTKGMKGNVGYPGYKGEKGQQSVSGPQGPPGPPGPPGSQCCPTLSTIHPTTAPTCTVATSGQLQCGGPGWRRVVFLNMANTSHVCPSGLRLTSYSKRTCGRASYRYFSCSSTTFSSGGSQYSRVCGRALAYRFGIHYGFYGYWFAHQGIDGYYVDGLSLTHGAAGGSRQHIWTFASGQFTGTPSSGHQSYRCPCDNGDTSPSPPFVGNDYFCESTRPEDVWGESPRFYPDALLWDGRHCEGGGTCCQFNNPPWFTKNLTSPTTDSIELRLCLYRESSYSDVALELLELYVQ